MRARALEEIKALLSSVEPEEIRKGLAKARHAAKEAPPGEAETLFEMVAALFYVDPLDRPDLAPVLDEAITAVAELGPRLLPGLLAHIDAGDVKAQIAVGHALGRMGTEAVKPLLSAYQATTDMDRRCFILYALGKISSPEVVAAAPFLIDGASSPDRELRDTATRAIGRFAENVPPGRMTELTRRSIVSALETNLEDPSPAIRAKAVRSLGKLGKHGHLSPEERSDVIVACCRLSGRSEPFQRDRAYVVRLEAEEALRNLGAAEAAQPAPALKER